MRKRLRKSLAGILALLMVVTNFQLTGLQVSAEEVTTEDKTYTMAEMDQANELLQGQKAWGVETENLSDGGQILKFGGLYNSIFWTVPAELKDAEITQIKFNVKPESVSGIEGANLGWFGYKIFVEEGFIEDKKNEGNGIGEGVSMYGNTTREVPPDLGAPIKYLAITSANEGITGPVEMEISSITFTVKKDASSESGSSGNTPSDDQTGGDQTGSGSGDSQPGGDQTGNGSDGNTSNTPNAGGSGNGETNDGGSGETIPEITAEVTTTDVDKTYSLGKLTEKSLSNVKATHNEASGSMKLEYAEQYGEANYEIPEDIDFTKVKKITITLKSGNAGDLAIKTYTQADWDAEGVYQTDAEYGKGYLVPTTDLADVKYIGISSLPKGTTSAVVESITFTVEGAVTYPISLLEEAKKDGVTVTVDNGSEKLDFASQYKEIDYKVPADVNFANVKKVSFKLTDGTTNDLTIKTYTQSDFEDPNIYQTDADYWKDYIEPKTNVADVKYIALANNGEVAKSITVESVTFTYTEASSVGVNPDAEEDDSNKDSDNQITAKVTTTDVDKTYSLGKLTKKSLSNVKATHNEASGSMKLEYADQYGEANYEIPEDIDFTKVKKITITLKSGNAGDLAIKTYTQADWDAEGVYQTDVEYGKGYLVPTTDLADVKYIGISSLPKGTTSAVVESITFTVEGAVTYPVSLLEEAKKDGVTVTVDNGSEKLDFASQYKEIDYKVPADVNFANVKKVSFKLTDGTTNDLTIKTYTQSDFEDPNIYQTDADYWKDYIEPKTNVADVKYIALANNGEAAKSITVESVTFTYTEASSVGVNPDAEEDSNDGTTGSNDLTFTADEVSVQWGTATSEQVKGKINIGFVNQYDQVKIQLPQSINMANCESVKFVVADQNIPIALKLWVGTEEKERWVDYNKNGSTEYVVTPNITDTIDVVGIMSSVDTIPADAKVSFISVTFKMKPGSSSGSGSSTPENLGENIIINGNFADADVSMWDSNQGSSVISATSGDKAIFDDVKTYGVIDRTASDIKEEKSTGHGFVQDVTDRVEKGGEYYIEYYAMLSEDYADAPDAQKMVEFLPYFVLDGKEQYLGAAYSAELSGFKSEPAKVGEWTKFSGYFTISCRGEEDKVVLRFMEQGTNYGSGDCVQGDYYITGVSMRRTDKPIPEIPEIEKDIPDWRDTIVGDLGAGTIAGTAVTASEMRDETLMELVTKHFNAVTFGNELKLDAMIGSKKFETVKFNGEDLYVPILNHSTTSTMLDKILAWNTANPDKQIKVRGHVFVWHSQAPSWFFKENYDDNAAYVSKEVMDKRLEWYIKTMLEYYTGPNSKYKDLFYGWDVVNEAINDSTNTYRGASESSWAAVYGDQSNEYIIKAFQYANKYAPASLELYYNDYNDCVPGKVQGIVNLMKAVLAEEGTRIDAMGMQAHHDMKGPSVEQVEAAVRAYCEVVGKVQWTELDIKASSSYDGTDATRDDEYSKMAHLYKDYYEVLKKLDAEDGIEVSGITFWGVVDKYSWLQTSNSVGGASSGGKQCPLLFDDNYKAKPAFWAFVDSNKLTPEVQNIVAISYVDDTYSQGNVYNIAQGNTKATFVPMWDAKGLKVLVDVQDATVDAADAVTVYVDAAMTAGETTPVAVTVKRADAEATSGGYKAVVEVPVSGTAVAKQVLMDVVVVNGTEKAAFNDTTFAQATNSKYYAVVMMKPAAKIEKGTVVVDGTVDELWSDVDAISLNINKGSTVEATAKLLWDENYLYVLYEVKDSVLNKAHKDAWEQDSVEVFIDENNGKTASLDADDKQYRVGYENDQSFNGQKCTADNMKSVAKTTADGYMVEAAFKWTDITPEDGTKIGLELQINDASAEGKRVGTLSWFDETGMGYAGSNVFGTVTLNERGLKEMVDDLSVLVDENATKEEKKQAVIEIIAEVKELVANKDTEELTTKYVEEIEELFEESIGRALDVVNKYNSVPQIDKVIGALIGIDADKDAKIVFESTTANALGAEYRNAIAFDIKLFADDEAVQPLVPVTIRMAIPPCINKNGKVVVLHYADGSFVPEKLPTKIIGDKIEFTTTSFSTFVIANEVALENNNGGSNAPAATPTPAPSTDSGVKAPATGDSAYPAAVVAVLLLSGSAAVIMARRKKEEEEKN